MRILPAFMPRLRAGFTAERQHVELVRQGKGRDERQNGDSGGCREPLKRQIGE